jgi:hypothetical protein
VWPQTRFGNSGNAGINNTRTVVQNVASRCTLTELPLFIFIIIIIIIILAKATFFRLWIPWYRYVNSKLIFPLPHYIHVEKKLRKSVWRGPKILVCPWRPHVSVRPWLLSPTMNTHTGTQSLIRNPWDQTRFGNWIFSDFGMVVRGVTGQELSESIAQLISTNW